MPDSRRAANGSSSWTYGIEGGIQSSFHQPASTVWARDGPQASVAETDVVEPLDGMPIDQAQTGQQLADIALLQSLLDALPDLIALGEVRK